MSAQARKRGQIVHFGNTRFQLHSLSALQRNDWIVDGRRIQRSVSDKD